MPQACIPQKEHVMKIDSIRKTDLVVIGGGIGGLMAAIAASDNGVKNITVIEKANIKRSGAGGGGNDHFRCYLPEVHGAGPDDFIAVMAESMNCHTGNGQDPTLAKLFLERSAEVVHQWEGWGINMRPHGEYVFAGHAFPGRPRIFLKYDGSRQKPILARETAKRGIEVLNDCSSTDILTVDGKIAGVLVIDSSSDEEPRFILLQCRAIVIATGCSTRLYNNEATPGWMFNSTYPGCNAGAMAQAFRVGARFVNMELPVRWGGPKFFQRCGKGSWIGVLRYPDGRPIGPFVTKSTVEYGDITSDVWNSVFTDVIHNGTGPAYIDASDASEEDLLKQKEGFISEGLSCILQYFKDHDLDFRHNAFEFMQYEPFVYGRGLEIDTGARTSVAGLYAAGDTVGNVRSGIGLAAVYGMIAGETAAAEMAGFEFHDIESHPLIGKRLEMCGAMLGRKAGIPWKEANLALQQIMSGYVPAAPYHVRSATLMNAGLKYLADLRKEALANMGAVTAHQLVRTLETVDLMDIAESLFHAALARQESRGMHQRSDFPFTNPLLNNTFINVAIDRDGKITTSTRERWLAPGMPTGRV